ncbi:MAG TPA: hypothetical protein PLD55_11550 [bacterium]|nr:hypothetical protein [bacterium]HNZ53509.1 hypothetical protein [bacterium]HOB70418.1 hypothetical protein [bacterium]HOG44070.1 hypothetical protein [bacterium]HPV21589.1 hypothetical protein [bacterium]
MRLIIIFFIFLLLLSCSDGKSNTNDEDQFVNDDVSADELSQVDDEKIDETENDSDADDVEDAATCEHGAVRNCVDFESFERCVTGSWTTIILKHKGLEWSCVKSYCKESSGERMPNIQELRTLIQNCPEVEYPKPEGLDSWCEIEKLCVGCDYDKSGKYSVFLDTGWLRSSSVTEIDNQNPVICLNFSNAGMDICYLTEKRDARCVRQLLFF